MKWPRIAIETSDGPRDAIAPQIISASRSSDIPAFHAKWFAERLQAGYCKWVNPFNRQAQYVSFENTRAIVFWSKYPAPIVSFLSLLNERDIAYYFQFTVNDYEDEGLEPNVPSLSERIRVFKDLSSRIGKDRVIWRFDPLVLTAHISTDDLLRKIMRIGSELHPFTEKLVFSFIDVQIYAKVRNNLKRCGVAVREFDMASMREFAGRLVECAKAWGLKLCTCGESVDLSSFGIEHNRCIDDELILRLARHDPELLRLLRRGSARGVDLFSSPDVDRQAIKDKGQREACGCVISKDIGQYNTCPHLCMYCYANTSARVVQENIERATATSESILPVSSNIGDEREP
ncbi:MAG: DUF1848 domain-containing protein [Thermoguttaceae bacterium]|jgi:hypothetical protein|nr:DUF1848 domain-containing protein [Thermoguttaceae bacterium]